MITIRPARREDANDILRLIKALAEYEKLSSQVTATTAILEQNLFGSKPSAEVLIAILSGETVGFALFFSNFSTFLGKPGLYLEDLFVIPEARGKGIGLALFKKVAQLAHERGCGRMEWSVLDWNQSAIGFYLKLGAIPMNEWTVYRLTESALANLVDH